MANWFRWTKRTGTGAFEQIIINKEGEPAGEEGSASNFPSIKLVFAICACMFLPLLAFGFPIEITEILLNVCCCCSIPIVCFALALFIVSLGG